jgi:hypothetical protein
MTYDWNGGRTRRSRRIKIAVSAFTTAAVLVSIVVTILSVDIR